MSEAPYRILHIGPGRYAPLDRTHSTYPIWQNLAEGFGNYHVMARSTLPEDSSYRDGPLHVHTFASFQSREFEFLWRQFRLVPAAIALKPDCVVVQSPVLGGMAGVQIARKLGIPIIVELHGMEYLRPAGWSPKLQLLQRLARWVYGCADIIRVLSTGMREDLIAKIPNLDTAKVRILPPRVDLSVFSNASATYGETVEETAPLRLTMVGAVNRNKGQLRLLQDLRNCPTPLIIRLIGDGPDLLRCKDLASAMPEHIKCEVLGRLPQHQVAHWLRQTDIFVMYSRSEGTPRAIMEAMAMGLAVVSTDAGYCRDLVSDQVTGAILPQERSGQALLDCLAELHKNRAKLEQWSQAGQEKARTQYDSVVQYEAYRQLIVDTIVSKLPSDAKGTVRGAV